MSDCRTGREEGWKRERKNDGRKKIVMEKGWEEEREGERESRREKREGGRRKRVTDIYVYLYVLLS